MNVLSLFDGISCGQQAIKELGINVDNYFASEIDPKAIAVTQKNHPNTIQLGDIKKLNLSQLPKIDLVLAGSPCQGLSRAGLQRGLEDDRSKLFFHAVAIKDTLQPTYFLFENVVMPKEQLKVISSYLGVDGLKINSKLFSAQSRDRYYWTNIPKGELPEFDSLAINDIRDWSDDTNISLSSDFCTIYHLRDQKFNPNEINVIAGLVKSTGTPRKPLPSKSGDFRTNQRVVSSKGKYSCLTAAALTAYIKYPDILRKPSILELERLQTLPDDYTAILNKTSRIKAIGNGWNVATVKHLLKNLKPC